MSISPKQALLKKYALVAQALATPVRLMLLEQLAQTEAAVEMLARKTGLTVADASQHLQQLRRAGLVTSRRAGKAVIYQLQDARCIALMGLLSAVAEANLAKVTDILDGLCGGAPARPGARQVSLAGLDALIPTLDPETEIVAYCRGPYCIYAHQAVTALCKHGLNARRLDGGLPEWREDGRAVLTASSP